MKQRTSFINKAKKIKKKRYKRGTCPNTLDCHGLYKAQPLTIKNINLNINKYNYQFEQCVNQISLINDSSKHWLRTTLHIILRCWVHSLSSILDWMFSATATSRKSLFSMSPAHELNAHTQWRCFFSLLLLLFFFTPVLSLIQRNCSRFHRDEDNLYVWWLFMCNCRAAKSYCNRKWASAMRVIKYIFKKKLIFTTTLHFWLG